MTTPIFLWDLLDIIAKLTSCTGKKFRKALFLVSKILPQKKKSFYRNARTISCNLCWIISCNLKSTSSNLFKTKRFNKGSKWKKMPRVFNSDWNFILRSQRWACSWLKNPLAVIMGQLNFSMLKNVKLDDDKLQERIDDTNNCKRMKSS